MHMQVSWSLNPIGRKSAAGKSRSPGRETRNSVTARSPGRPPASVSPHGGRRSLSPKGANRGVNRRRRVGRPRKLTEIDKAKAVGNGKAKRGRVIEPSSEEEEEDEDEEAEEEAEEQSSDSEAESGYKESEDEEAPAVPDRKRRAGAEAAGKATVALNQQNHKAKRGALANKSASSKPASVRKKKEVNGQACDAGSDGDEETEEECEDESVYVCTRNGGGRDGPINIALPGAAHTNWHSDGFCLLVDNNWRRERGFHLLEVDAKSKKVLERAGERECRVTARLWYCAKELEPKGGFEAGKHGFLPLSKSFKTWVLPGSSWLPVVAVQRTRVKVEEEYNDSDEGILSLKKGELGSASGEEANGWAQLRADSGEEGWFPAGYVRFTRKYVELEEEEDKVMLAYRLLPQTKTPRKDKKMPVKLPVRASPSQGQAVPGIMFLPSTLCLKDVVYDGLVISNIKPGSSAESSGLQVMTAYFLLQIHFCCVVFL